MLTQKLFHPIVHQLMIKTCIFNGFTNRSESNSLSLFFRKHWHTQWKFKVNLGVIVVINCQLSAWSVQLSAQKINARMAQGKYNGTETYMKSHLNFCKCVLCIILLIEGDKFLNFFANLRLFFIRFGIFLNFEFGIFC